MNDAVNGRSPHGAGGAPAMNISWPWCTPANELMTHIMGSIHLRHRTPSLDARGRDALARIEKYALVAFCEDESGQKQTVETVLRDDFPSRGGGAWVESDGVWSQSADTPIASGFIVRFGVPSLDRFGTTDTLALEFLLENIRGRLPPDHADRADPKD